MRALMISDNGFEDRELTEPLQQLEQHGIAVDLAAPRKGTIAGKHGHGVEAALAIDQVRREHYDLLVLPGGKAPAKLQKHARAVAIAWQFLAAGKPVAAICHGPQILVPTGLLAGRTVTGYPGIAAELRAAGANFVDREVVVDGRLVTSRRPADLPAFIQAILTIVNGTGASG